MRRPNQGQPTYNIKRAQDDDDCMIVDNNNMFRNDARINSMNP